MTEKKTLGKVATILTTLIMSGLSCPLQQVFNFPLKHMKSIKVNVLNYIKYIVYIYILYLNQRL